MRTVVWVFRAFVFFALFAFALNNQQEARVNWFFGYAWPAPMVIIVLAAFVLGTVFGVLCMAPSWWRQRRLARKAAPQAPSSPKSTAPVTRASADPTIPDGI